MTNIYLLVGIPASGKTTWAEQQVEHLNGLGFNTKYISRDAIRFSLVKEDENYFCRENEVFARFIKEINDSIKAGVEAVIVDATHINPISRYKVLSRIRGQANANLIVMVFDVPVEVCLKRNKNREGRKRVPENVIRQMAEDFACPTQEEFQRCNFTRVEIERVMNE